MAHIPRTVLREIRREAVWFRDEHRRTLQRERQALAALRDEPRKHAARDELRGHTAYHSVHRGEHKQLLGEAKRIAREGLEEHKRALEANPWILRMVDVYDRMQAVRAERDRRRAQRRAAGRNRVAVRPVGSEV
jgi:hypothetical protein